MSKKKAKLKAQRRMEKRLKEQLEREAALEAEKVADAELAEQQILRNQGLLQVKKAKEQRQQADKSPEKAFIEKNCKPLLDQVIQLIGDDEVVARQFVLEEVEAASMGDHNAQQFVKLCGISKQEYTGALENSHEKVDGTSGPQQFLNHAFSEIRSSKGIDWAVKLRIAVVDRVMQVYKLGRYATHTAGSKGLQLQETNVGAEPSSIDEAAKPITEITPFSQAFDEYSHYCKDPSIGLDRLSNYILVLRPYIKHMTSELEDHFTFVRMVALCSKSVRSKRIPKNILDKGIFTELALVSVVRFQKWISAVRSLVSSGENQNKLMRAIELGWQVGNPEEPKCAINVAPAICNTMSLIYQSESGRPEMRKFSELMWDTSLVKGGTQGSLNAQAKYRRWVFDMAGIH